jgi:hypothetical protein
MSAAPTVLSQTLQSITITKIRQLQKQRAAFELSKAECLEKVDNIRHDQRKNIRVLLEAVEELDTSPATKESLSNIKRWLEQSEYDPSIPDEILYTFEEQLRSKLNIQSRRLGLAHLYSSLLTEWLRSSGSNAGEQEITSLEDDPFEVVEKDRLQQLRSKFEAVVFEPLETDEVEISLYMAELFSGDNDPNAMNRKRTVALDRIRSELNIYSDLSLKAVAPFDEQSLRWSIKGLLKNDLLSDSKKIILTEFLQDEVALGEIRDVLNMKYVDLKNWTWEADDGMPVEPRRQLNGKYRIMMDEDVLQAIFLHYIGVTWCVSMKRVLTEAIRYTHLWKKGSPLPPQEEEDKRKFFLGSNVVHEEKNGGIEKWRQYTYSNDFFLSQLPSSVYQGAGGYDDDEDDEDEERDPKIKSPKVIKQQLLRQLATEIHIRRALDGEVAVVQSDLQWFATGIPHSTIFAVLRFLGMSEIWLGFFKKFLEAPMNMGPVSEDTSAPHAARIRKRGMPMAHALEKLFGEVVLFAMDLAVNQEAGMLLYRLHDDLWLCGKPDDCATAWKAMEKFAAVMGLEFNRKKTGSVYLTRDGEGSDYDIVTTLPTGPVAVGFLTLDPTTGSWIIDQKEVDAHIKQLQKQLLGCKSILSWVQTWNSCIGRFFNDTFGEPANCFGKPHVNSILETHKRLQEFLFNNENDTGNNVTVHLKNLIKQRFGITDVPDAFIYLPEQLGGLGVTNPFLPLFLVREQLFADPGARMTKFLEDEKRAYENYKDNFHRLDESSLKRLWTNVYGLLDGQFSSRDESFQLFMSFRQYIEHRESRSGLLLEAYNDLMRVPTKKRVPLSRAVVDAFEMLEEGGKALLEQMEPEKKWALQFHSQELFEKCGGLSMVDKTLLPLGVLTMLRKRKVTWQMVL